MPRARARSLPRAVPLVAGDWQGMDDTPDPVAANAQFVALARNAYLPPRSAGSSYVGRPGFALAGEQLGSVGQREVQYIGQFTTQGGDEYTVAIVYGEIYTYNWSTDAWTQVVTAANFVTASVSIETTGRIRGKTFANLLILSDGVNFPFSWDGSTGSGGLATLSAADVLYGPLWVRAAKLGGIKAGERDTWIWSEEGTPNTGYEDSGYTNAWTVPNPGNERLVAGVASNSAITLFWDTSASVILGATNDEWTTGNTTPSVSQSLGTQSPDAVLALDEGVVFVDQGGRPHIIPAGASQPVPLYERCRQALATINRSALANVLAIEDRATETLKIGYPDASESYPSKWLVYTRDGGRLTLTGIESGYLAQVAGMVKDAQGRWVWMHAGVDDGYIYRHGTPEDGPWSDADGTDTVPIQRELLTMALGTDTTVEKLFDTISVQGFAPTTQTLTLSYITPRASSTPQSVSLMGFGSAFDSAKWDQSTFGGESNDTRARVGVLGRGRWIQVLAAQATVGEQFGIERIPVMAFDEGAEPAIP